MAFDYLIVGAGYAGSVLAERLATQLGKRVLIVDKRSHIGGNAFDMYDQHGVLIHPYGPHIFHTNSLEVFNYLGQFTQWRPYQHRVIGSVEGQLVPIPFNMDSLHQLFPAGYAARLEGKLVERYGYGVKQPILEMMNEDDADLKYLAEYIYKNVFLGYTLKQWERKPDELDASVTSRVPVNISRDDRYFADKYQAMPLHGYTRMFERMLAHPNIKIMLNTDYREIIGFVPFDRMIYTGPVDAFFNHRYGKLPYRSLHFEHQTLEQRQYQATGTVNFPNEYQYTRITEFKHLTGQTHEKTSIVFEYPRADGDPYYPIPMPEYNALYKRYESDALLESPKVLFVGRLATYRYYNMDQIVAQALSVFNKQILPQETEREARAT
jgi:UDP-galactopyranose mutase